MLTKPNCMALFVVFVRFVFIVCSAVGLFGSDSSDLWP